MSNQRGNPIVPLGTPIDPTLSGLRYYNAEKQANLYQDALVGFWTPILGATVTNPNLNGGLVTGDYRYHAGWVEARFTIHFATSGSSAGSGEYTITGLPFQVDIPNPGDMPIGRVHLRNVGVASFFYDVIARSSTELRMVTDGAPTVVTEANPFAWGGTDSMRGQIRYKAVA